MRTLLIAATALLAVSSAAYAEGNGEPFPGPDAGINTPVGSGISTRMQDPFHYSAPSTVYNYGTSPTYTARMQDPYQFRAPDQVIAGQATATVAQAPASNGSVGSKAQGLVATQGTHG